MATEPTEPSEPDRPAGTADDPAVDPAVEVDPNPSGAHRAARGRLIPVHAAGALVQDLVIRPWPQQRARRTRWIALVLLVLAPLVATLLTFWGIGGADTSTVVEPEGKVADSVLFVDATAVDLDLQRNEMSFRLVFRPSGEIFDGRALTEEVSVVVNDVLGSSVRTFDAGLPMEPTTVVVDMTGSQLRYPFDSYDAELAVGAVVGSGDDQAPLELDLEVGASLDQFDTAATAERRPNAATVQLELNRRAAVIIWVLFFMGLVWCIAMGGACVAWFIVVFAKDPPMWAFPFFAAILFALPTLRAGLPGTPPYGSLVDWGAFYWGIAILAGALIALLVVWNIEARVKVRDSGASARSPRRRRG
jgi:hypothetical protein